MANYAEGFKEAFLGRISAAMDAFDDADLGTEDGRAAVNDIFGYWTGTNEWEDVTPAENRGAIQTWVMSLSDNLADISMFDAGVYARP